MSKFLSVSGSRVVHDSPSPGRRRWYEEQRRKNVRRLIAAGAVLILLTLVGAGFAFRYQSKPAVVPLETAGKIINVRRGGNFQAALNQAKPGDTIVLEAGAAFTGAFELPNKTGAAEFITIQSSALDKLPPEGARVAPRDAAAMPKILSHGKSAAAIYAAPYSSHYRFVGVEFGVANDEYVYNLILLGDDANPKPEAQPRFIEFDRCYLSTRGINKVRRAFALNNADTVIKNSYVAGFAGAGDETQAIAGWNGVGRFKIINNHLEGGAENILFGGADPIVPNLVPSDIEIRNNFLTKPAAWRDKVLIKNSLELKNARRVQIVGNIIENCFGCDALLLTVRNQDGKAPWSVIEDVEFSHNLIRSVGNGVNILGSDDIHKSQRLKRARIFNNLFESINQADGEGYFLKLADGEDIEISHNTIFQDGNMMTLHRAPSARFVFRNNIMPYNEYGVWGEDAGVNIPYAFNKYFRDGSITGNILANEFGLAADAFIFTPRNFLVPSLNAIGFADRNAKNFRLAANSRFKAKTGKDPGCDIDALERAVAGVETSAKSGAK